jgi:hypothetical protein
MLQACESFAIRELDCHVARNPALLTVSLDKPPLFSSAYVEVKSTTNSSEDVESLIIFYLSRLPHGPVWSELKKYRDWAKLGARPVQSGYPVGLPSLLRK